MAAPRLYKHVIAGGVASVLVAGAVTATVLARTPSLTQCLTGSWRATSYVTTVTNNGHVTTNTIMGLRMEYRADGTMRMFYADATARVDGEIMPLSGTVTYEYQVDRDRISYTNGRAQHGSEEFPEQDYTETAGCAGGDSTLTGIIEYDGDSRAEWTIALTRE